MGFGSEGRMLFTEELVGLIFTEGGKGHSSMQSRAGSSAILSQCLLKTDLIISPLCLPGLFQSGTSR